MKVTMMHCYIPGCSPPAQAWHCQTCWRKGKQQTLPRQPGGELLGFWEWWIWWPAIQYKARCSCFPPKASKQQTPRSPPQALSIVIVIMTTILENDLGDESSLMMMMMMMMMMILENRPGHKAQDCRKRDAGDHLLVQFGDNEHAMI